VQFTLGIFPNAIQISRLLPDFFRQQFLTLKDPVDAYEKVEGLQWAGKIEFLAVLINQDIVPVTRVSLGGLHSPVRV